MKRMFRAAALGLSLLAVTATAQNMMRHVDRSSPDMVSAEMTRAEVEAALAAATVAAPADFTGKSFTVTLPTVMTNALSADGQTAGVTPFEIALTGCNADPGST